MTTVLCTRCGINQAPAPSSIEVDPLCDNCVEELACPGFDDSCSNLKVDGKRYCEDCEEKREAQAGTTIFAEVATPGCPGWGTGEDCGNPKLPGGDLCGDCHGARLDYESPYPGNPRRHPMH